MKKTISKLQSSYTKFINQKPTDKRVAYYLKNLYSLFFKHNVTGMAAQMSYYLLLSLFPFLLLISNLISTADVTSDFFGYMLGEEASAYLAAIITVPEGSGSAYTFLGSIVVVYSVSKSLMAFSRAFDTAYETKTSPKYIVKLISSMVFVAAIIALIIVAVLLGTLGGDFAIMVMEYFGIAGGAANLINIFRYVFSALFVFCAFLLIYKWLPSKKVTFRSVIPGALLCTLVIAIFSVAFSVYASYSFLNSPLQSTIGAVLLVLLWLYITSIIIILGSELNALVIKRKS